MNRQLVCMNGYGGEPAQLRSTVVIIFTVTDQE